MCRRTGSGGRGIDVYYDRIQREQFLKFPTHDKHLIIHDKINLPMIA